MADDDAPTYSTADILNQMPQQPSMLAGILRQHFPGLYDAVSRNAQPAKDMLDNAEEALAQGNQDKSVQLAKTLGLHDPEGAGATAAQMFGMIGGVKAPGQATAVRIPNPIKAYHGSPHDFNEFDLSKIGTGEGAQAYGHGLYFAENEPVAQSYRDANTPRHSAFDIADNIRDMANGDPSKYRELIGIARSNAPELTDKIDIAQKILEGNEPPGLRGRMYEVALHAPPESFLDWDKPINAQGDSAKNALLPLTDARIKDLQNVIATARRDMKPGPATDDYVAGLTARLDDAQKTSLAGNQPFGQSGLPNMAPEMADTLRQQGFHGTRYLDQGSRAEGQGTHNYVVWSPEIIEILRKYGLVGAAPLAGSTLSRILSQPSPTEHDQNG